VPLWWLERVTKVARSPQQVFVAIWLLHLHWESKSMSFTLANGRLAKYGIDRQAKRSALLNFEDAGLIKVERRSGKATRVTLIAL
jgi:hypothetical protein